MTTRTITLGGHDFAVPPLPLRINRQVYPICRALVQGNLVDRCIEAGGMLDCGEEELGQLATMAFLAASAAEPELTREAFDEMAVTPPELLEALFQVRYQTGAWIPAEAGAPAAEEGAGEARGAKRPRKSTSTAS